jgi:hypothetical protein
MAQGLVQVMMLPSRREIGKGWVTTVEGIVLCRYDYKGLFVRVVWCLCGVGVSTREILRLPSKQQLQKCSFCKQCMTEFQNIIQPLS